MLYFGLYDGKVRKVLGPLLVSHDDAAALHAYLRGDRESELVRSYFRRTGVGSPQQNPQLERNAQEVQ